MKAYIFKNLFLIYVLSLCKISRFQNFCMILQFEIFDICNSFNFQDRPSDNRNFFVNCTRLQPNLKFCQPLAKHPENIETFPKQF